MIYCRGVYFTFEFGFSYIKPILYIIVEVNYTNMYNVYYHRLYINSFTHALYREKFIFTIVLRSV